MLWGGREGYETLLNTDMKRELDQLGRFLTMVVEHKHKIGFKGTILIEPKPKEPTKHQYDFDVGTIYGMLKAYDLENEVKINIEQNHAILAGHTFEHEIALAGALGIFGSIDINRGDYLLGWDTDQFAMNVPGAGARAATTSSRPAASPPAASTSTPRSAASRSSRTTCSHAHVGSMDACARGLLIAEEIIKDGALDAFVDDRYAGWDGKVGKAILAGKRSLDDLSDYVLKKGSTRSRRAASRNISSGCSTSISDASGRHDGRKTTMKNDRRGRRSFSPSSRAMRRRSIRSTAWPDGRRALGYKGIQIPSWDGRLFDLKKAALEQDLLRRGQGHRSRDARPRDHRAVDPSPGPARRGQPGLRCRLRRLRRAARCAATRRRAPSGRSTR